MTCFFSFQFRKDNTKPWGADKKRPGVSLSRPLGFALLNAINKRGKKVFQSLMRNFNKKTLAFAKGLHGKGVFFVMTRFSGTFAATIHAP